MILFGWGAVITWATMAFFPAGEIWFGILTLLGVCMLLIPAVKRLPIAPAAGLGISLLLFILLRGINDGTAVFGLIPLPGAWYRNYFTAFLGFPPADFSSADYFPLLPWFFLFLTGYFTGSLFQTLGWLSKLRGNVPPLSWLGRHSLLLYLLHQPVFIGIIWILMNI